MHLLWLVSGIAAFYLPGLAPKDYKPGESVPLLVNALTSHSVLLPYDYYLPQLHSCRPPSGPIAQDENLGSILLGDRLFSSPFKLEMAIPQNCTALCTQTIPSQDSIFINRLIKDRYLVNWIVDGLPASQSVSDITTIGFQLGSPSSVHFHNHYDISIEFHEEKGSRRVVGVKVDPKSYSHGCGSASPTPLVLSETAETEVQYSYSVQWILSNTPWGTRWDHYLNTADTRVHWYSIDLIQGIFILIIGKYLLIIGSVLLIVCWWWCC